MSDDPIAESAPLLVAHINDEHADWALVVGRGFGDLPDAERAGGGARPRGVDLDGHRRTSHVAGSRSTRAMSTLQLQAFGVMLAREARQRSGKQSPH